MEFQQVARLKFQLTKRLFSVVPDTLFNNWLATRFLAECWLVVMQLKQALLSNLGYRTKPWHLQNYGRLTSTWNVFASCSYQFKMLRYT